MILATKLTVLVIHIRGVWGSSNQITQHLRQYLQLSSLASLALELQLLPLVLRNLITTTQKSTYMHITVMDFTYDYIVL